MFTLSSAAFSISIGLLIGVAHATICKPIQHSSLGNFMQTVEEIMDSTKKKTARSYALKIMQFCYVFFFWGGVVAFIVAYFVEFQKSLFAYAH